MTKTILLPLALAFGAALVGACDRAAQPAEQGSQTEASAPAEAAGADLAAADFIVYKSPTCGCCSAWIDHMREAGFQVEAVDLPQYADLAARKHEHSVPGDLGSCHTAVIDGYTIEGHVPAEVVARLLEERPDIKGLAVPGMPIGSPGMEGADPERYDVIAFTEDGERSVYQTIDPTQ